MTKPVDMRVVYDLGYEQLTTPLTSRDVLLVPNLFSDYRPGEIYEQLVAEIKTCGVSEVGCMHVQSSIQELLHLHYSRAC